MTIFLIRHGETDLNASRVLQLPETPLSERGRTQAALLADHLADAGIARIVSSDLARAEQTARALEATTKAPLEFEPLLQERNFGDLRGTPYAELDENPFEPGYEPPGGESEAVFADRVERAWERITALAERTDGALSVVTHGLVCRGIVQMHAAPGGGLEAPDSPLHFRNTSYTVIEGPGSWRAIRVACDDHLDAMADVDGGVA